MISKNKSSLIYNCDDVIFNFFIDHESKKIYLNQNISPEFILLMDRLLEENYEVIYLLSVEECPFCGCELSKNGTDKFLLNKSREIRMQKYVCKNKACKTHIKTSLEKFIAKHCNYTNFFRELALNIGSIAYLSYENKSELMELMTGVSIPRSTAHFHEKALADDYLDKKEKEISKRIKEEGIEPEGVYHYDEQVLWVNTDLKLRMTIIDATNNLIINEIVVGSEDFDKHTIKKFLKKSLKGLELKAIITDGHNAYPSIIEALGAIHQKCIFHKMQTLMKKVGKTVRRLNRQIKSNREEIEKNNLKINEFKEKNQGKKGRISKNDKKRQKFSARIKKLSRKNKDFRSKIREYNSKIKELKKYTDKISLMFRSKTKETAMKRFQKLNNQINELPEEISSFIKKLSKDIHSTLNHITNKDIPNTNNKLEGYYKITLPRYLKKIFKTDKGLEIRLRLNRIRWTERNVIKKNKNFSAEF